MAGLRARGLMLRGANKSGYTFKVKYNKVSNFGLGILSDLGGIKVGASPNPGGKWKGNPCQDATTRAELEDHCFTYAHIYNNLVLSGKVFHNGANGLYSDVQSCKVTFENNIIYVEGSG